MFRKTDTNPQLDLFTAPGNILPKRARKKYTDEKAWHNQFFGLVTSRIDEEAFKPLFEETKMGAPNASVRILVAMSILKEGFGCSDEDLFEKCEFDLLARKALGLEMLDDKLPSLDTYYLFGRRLTDYEQRTGINLMERCFEQVTGEQIKLFKISGNSVRMDSKLIGSNIAQYSRYELIHRTLCKVLREDCIIMMLNPKLRKGAEVWLGEDSSKTVYRSNKDEMAQKLIKIGLYIYDVLKRLKEDAPGYNLLHRVFHDQYVVEKGKVELKDKHKIASDSLQSPDDPDATYRDKGGQKVSGYVTNITETVEEDKPSIITSVQTEPVTYADCHFLEDAVRNTERVTGHIVDNVYSDGAYQSPENREFAKLHMGMELLTSKLQGGSRYLLDREPGTDNLKVTDTETGEILDTIYVGENMMFCILIIGGTSSAIMTIGGILLGEQDIDSYRGLANSIAKKSFLAAIALSLILFMFPNAIASAFGASGEMLERVSGPLRQFTLILAPFCLMNLLPVSYTVLGHRKLSSILNITSVALILALFCLICYFMPDRIWNGMPIIVWSTLGIYILTVWFYSRKDSNINHLTLIPVYPNDPAISRSVSYSTEALKDALRELRLFISICEFPPEYSDRIFHCIEELSINIIDMANSSGKEGCFDIRVVQTPEKLLVVFKDDNRPYNPIFTYKPGADITVEEENLSLALVNAYCSDINYKYMNGINCTYLNFPY